VNIDRLFTIRTLGRDETDGWIDFVFVLVMTDFVIEIFSRWVLLFLARKQEINAINIRITPARIRIQPARKRDLSKRIASEKKKIHFHF
jgi:hypothetical protein